MAIWVSPKMGKHGPRIKVQRKSGNKVIPNNWISITVEDEPRIIKGIITRKAYDQIVEFIKLNRKILVAYWEQKISTKDFSKKLKKI